MFTRGAASTDPPAPLTVLLQSALEWVLTGLLARLHAQGHRQITQTHLILLGNLDCGATHAAAVASRMGVSRQAIFRTVRDLEALGILRLQQDQDRGNQKLVVMTDHGMALIADARKALADIEHGLDARIGATATAALRSALQQAWGPAIT
jgi:DNA-binding MarR family transcriptional regulator